MYIHIRAYITTDINKRAFTTTNMDRCMNLTLLNILVTLRIYFRFHRQITLIVKHIKRRKVIRPLKKQAKSSAQLMCTVKRKFHGHIHFTTITGND